MMGNDANCAPLCAIVPRDVDPFDNRRRQKIAGGDVAGGHILAPGDAFVDAPFLGINLLWVPIQGIVERPLVDGRARL